MNQVYNLLEIIEQDKKAVALLKKRLHHAESILAAHEAALGRLTIVPELPHQGIEKVAQNGLQEPESAVQGTIKERITSENLMNLGIKEGDKVEIVCCDDKDFEKGIYDVEYVEDDDYKGIFPFRLSEEDTYESDWFEFRGQDGADDELYLIRTEEGSLNN